MQSCDYLSKQMSNLVTVGKDEVGYVTNKVYQEPNLSRSNPFEYVTFLAKEFSEMNTKQSGKI